MEIIFCQVLQNKSWKGFLKPFSEGILDISEGVASPLVTLTLLVEVLNRDHSACWWLVLFFCPAAFSFFKIALQFYFRESPLLTVIPSGLICGFQG